MSGQDVNQSLDKLHLTPITKGLYGNNEKENGKYHIIMEHVGTVNNHLCHPFLRCPVCSSYSKKDSCTRFPLLKLLAGGHKLRLIWGGAQNSKRDN